MTGPARTVAPLPMAPASVSTVLDLGVATRPHQEALVDTRHRLDYKTLNELVCAIATGFANIGLERGQRVAMSLPNSVHAVVSYLACMRAGLVFVGVHPGLAVPEKQLLLQRARPDLVLATGAIIDTLRGSTGEHVALDLNDPTMAELARPPFRQSSVPDPHAAAAIAFTSGTTGEPKGVVHDQHHMILPASVILHHRLGGRGERIGVHLPLTTLNALVVAPVLAFLGGGTCVCIDGHEASALAETIETERIEHLSTSPAVVYDLLEHPDVDPRRQLQNLRLGVGGASCPEQLRRSYAAEVGRTFTTGYGLTEAPASVVQETERVPHRTGASGMAMAHVGLEIVDEDGHVVENGITGEVTVVAARSGRWARCFRGLLSYHEQPEETTRVLADSRLRTGDFGSLDEDGYLYVADRRSDMINRGGSKVSPVEVEQVLLRHPAVVDCIVVGRPSERLGQSVAAVIQTRAGSEIAIDDLREHCAASLARYKVPSDLMVVAELPRNPMGKVIRSVVSERIAEWSDADDVDDNTLRPVKPVTERER